MPTTPDLPTPITPDDAPGQLPVEPVDGLLTPLTQPGEPDRSFTPERAVAHFVANRNFMRAASFRWPKCRTVAFAFPR